MNDENAQKPNVTEARKYAAAALNNMEAQGVVPTPENFQIWYEKAQQELTKPKAQPEPETHKPDPFISAMKAHIAPGATRATLAEDAQSKAAKLVVIAKDIVSQSLKNDGKGLELLKDANALSAYEGGRLNETQNLSKVSFMAEGAKAYIDYLAGSHSQGDWLKKAQEAAAKMENKVAGVGPDYFETEAALKRMLTQASISNRQPENQYTFLAAILQLANQAVEKAVAHKANGFTGMEEQAKNSFASR